VNVRTRRRHRRGEGDKLRGEIIAAAQDLLVETASEDAVSIRAVADAVGVTPPSIYRHFADKDMLLLEVCQANFATFTTALEALPPETSPVGRLQQLGRAYMDYAREYPEHYRMMFMARYELSAQQYAEEMVADGSSFRLLLQTMEEVIASGVLRPELAERGALHLGILFWSVVHGLASLFVAKPGLPWPDHDELVEDLLAVSIRGILDDPSLLP
jgi:AcrR family transcriptional regulator